jgi:gamma-glutamylcyclotransferase (GGCT)/AIG2-like uncharacterized protein YtfP
MTVRLLVYGLLRRGEPMHGLLAGAEFLGEQRLEGYDLFDLGEYPAAAPGTGVITAELYDLPSPAVLQVLDEAERVPTLYRRELVRDAWLYVYARPVERAPRIRSGDWRSPPRP